MLSLFDKQAGRDYLKQDIREHIKSEEVNKTINPDKQNRHVRGIPEYIEGGVTC